MILYEIVTESKGIVNDFVYSLLYPAIWRNVIKKKKKRKNLNERKRRYLNLSKETLIKMCREELLLLFSFLIFYFIIVKGGKYYV